MKIFKPNPWYPSVERVFVESSNESAHEEEKNFEEPDYEIDQRPIIDRQNEEENKLDFSFSPAINQDE